MHYKLSEDFDGYASIYQTWPEKDKTFDEQWDFRGKSKTGIWKPCQVEVERIYNGRLVRAGDFYVFGLAPVFSEKAYEVLYSLLSPCGEFLPLESDRGKLYAFNTLQILDALDKEKSKIKFFPNSERVMRIEKYVLKPEVIGATPIFKIPECLPHTPFVTGCVREAVENARLEGFKFVPEEAMGTLPF